MTVLIEHPNDARARPTSLIKDEDLYAKLFSDDHNLEIYRICAGLHFSVNGYLRRHRNKIDAIYRNNLRYYVMMVVAWQIAKVRPIPGKALIALDVKLCTDELIDKCMKWVIAEFYSAGAVDATAKDAAFTKQLQDNWPGPLA